MNLIEIILNIVILLFLLYISFLKKYFEKKGENLATKQDIATITKLTETSRLEFLKKIEDYKQELILKYEFIDLIKDYKISLFKSTVTVLQNLTLWSNNRNQTTHPNLIQETLDLLESILLELNCNAILLQQYSTNHKKIESEFNNLLTSINQGQKQGSFHFNISNLVLEFKELQSALLR